MIYISKGIVQEKSTERNIYVGRGGQVFQLTKIEAQLWLDGRFGFYTTKNASQERAIEHLYRMGLVEFEQEDTFVARYRILTRCVLCAAANSNISLTVGRFESSILNWLTNAGIRLSMASLSTFTSARLSLRRNCFTPTIVRNLWRPSILRKISLITSWSVKWNTLPVETRLLQPLWYS